MTAPQVPCAVNGSTVDTLIECIRRTLGLSDLPSVQDVRGTTLEQLYMYPVTFQQRDGYLYYCETDRVWQFATQPLPSTATRTRIVVRANPAP